MKKIACILLFCGLVLTGFSQDLIVTTDNDSLYCRITSIENDVLYFDIMTGENIRSVSYPLSYIDTYKYNYYLAEIIKKKTEGSASMPPIKISVLAGGEMSFLKTTRWSDHIFGYFVGTDFSYYITKMVGIGLKFKFSHAIEKDEYPFFDLSNFNSLLVQEELNTYLFFVGPSFALRVPDKLNKHAFILHASIGYMHDREVSKATVSDLYTSYQDKKIANGGNFGGGIDIGYDFRVSKKLVIGPQLSFYYTILSKFKYDNQIIYFEKGNRFRLGHLDLGIAFRFYP